MGDRKNIFIALFFVFLIFPLYADGAQGALSDEAKICLTCHSDKEMHKILENKEAMPLYINKDEFADSVHNIINCSACHTGYDDLAAHIQEKKQIKSKREYSVNASRVCSTCHSDEQLKKTHRHRIAMTKALCADCHGSHDIKSMAEWKKGINEAKRWQQRGFPQNKRREWEKGINETKYCLTCHRHDHSMALSSGEVLSLYISESEYKSSIHGNFLCSTCHTDFSVTKHPEGTSKSIRAYTLASAELCKKCHSDAYKQYESSAHYTSFKSGNPQAPHCSDCHGSAHSLTSTKTDKTIGLISCSRCHGEINSSYEASVHNKARLKGKANAPVCSSCHNAHNIESTKMTAKINEGCFKCHKDMVNVHNKWLKNPPVALSTFTEAHFDAVSCAACHSTDSTHRVYLSLVDTKTGKPLTEEEIMKIIGTGVAGLKGKIDTNGDGSIEGKEMWNLFWLLSEKGKKTTFMGRMDVSSASEAHRIGTKAEATRECAKCHHHESQHFGNVSIVISKDNGETTLLPVRKGALSSAYLLLMRKFHVFGGTNINLFDTIFYVALLGSIAIPVGHIILRIITLPIRSLRRMGKGGKN